MGKQTFGKFVKEQRTKPLPVFRADLSGKTVIVLGANIGLGFETAKHLASMKPGKLILACRNQAKGEEAVKQITGATSCETIELRIIDLADFASVKQFAKSFNDQEQRLDILIANSGVSTLEYETTKDGWETAMQVNHLGTALITLLLLPKMVNTAQEYNTTPRITVVSSNVHFWTNLDDKVLKSSNMIETMSSKEYCTKKIMFRRYQDSKLFGLFFVLSLVSRLPSPSPVIINAVEPGYCHSSLHRNMTGAARAFQAIFSSMFAIPTEIGSRRIVHAALSGDKAEMHGSYLSALVVREPSDFVLGETGKKTGDRLWNETITVLSKVEPQVQEVINTYLTA